MVDVPAWANKTPQQKAILEIFNPPDDGQPVAAPAWATKQSAVAKPAWAADQHKEVAPTVRAGVADIAAKNIAEYTAKTGKTPSFGGILTGVLKSAGKDAATGLKELVTPPEIGDLNYTPASGILKAAGGVARAAVAPLEAGVSLPAVVGMGKEKGERLGQDVAGLAQLSEPIKDSLKSSTAEKIKSPAIEDGGKIYTGGDHELIRQAMPEGSNKGAEANTGFVTDEGRFVGREEADKIAKSQGQFDHEIKGKGKLHSEELKKPEIAPLPERISDDLHQLSNRDEARRVGYVQKLKQIKDVPNATWEKLYAIKDNPALQATAEEKALYDTHLAPVAARGEQILAEFKKDGHDFGDTGRAPRQVKNKNPYVEKIYGGALQNKIGSGGKRISSFSPAAQNRSMWALPGKAGARKIVYVEDGKLFLDGEPVGEVLGKDTAPASGRETSLGKLEQATTAEIEAATKIDYHKNLLANEYLRLQSLERAKDARDFINYLKQDPEFLEYATTSTNKDAPASWRVAQGIKEFEGYKFDPKLAEQIEDYMGNIKSPEDYTNMVMNVAKATKASIFYNPIKHMINATNMFAVSKGVAGSVRDLPNTSKALLRAVKSVITQDSAFMESAKMGMSLPSMREAAQVFGKELTRAMGLAVQKNARGMTQIAKDWGYNSTVGMVKALYKGSNKLLWAYSDILAMTRVNEYMARGLSRAEAIARTEKVMANYRVPTRVMGSRNISKTLQDPRWTMFGRYDYNRFANLTGMIKRAASKDPLAWEARDQLLALATITTLGYTAVDNWMKEKTGSEGAHQQMGGYSQLADVGKDVLSGRKSVSQGLQSLFSPGLLNLPLEMVTGENMYTGKKIAQRGDFVNMVNALKEFNFKTAKDYAARIGFDLTRDMADKFAPVADIDKYLTGNMTPSEFWLSQLGTKIPTDEQEAGAAKAEKYTQRESNAAAKKRPGFVP